MAEGTYDGLQGDIPIVVFREPEFDQQPGTAELDSIPEELNRAYLLVNEIRILYIDGVCTNTEKDNVLRLGLNKKLQSLYGEANFQEYLALLSYTLTVLPNNKPSTDPSDSMHLAA